MFESALIESTAAHQPRRAWTALVSALAQAGVLFLLLLLPTLFTEALPIDVGLRRLFAPAAIPVAPASAVQPRGQNSASTSTARTAQLVTPTEIPSRIPPQLLEDGAPPKPSGLPGESIAGPGPGAPFGTGDRLAVLPIPFSPPPTRGPVRVSTLNPGQLLHRVDPAYPPEARRLRIEGEVVLRAIISREGEVQKLSVESGHPWLAKAAREAVEKWRYRPYILNGQAVEVETQVKVNFRLAPAM